MDSHELASPADAIPTALSPVLLHPFGINSLDKGHRTECWGLGCPQKHRLDGCGDCDLGLSCNAAHSLRLQAHSYLHSGAQRPGQFSLFLQPEWKRLSSLENQLCPAPQFLQWLEITGPKLVTPPLPGESPGLLVTLAALPIVHT